MTVLLLTFYKAKAAFYTPNSVSREPYGDQASAIPLGEDLECHETGRLFSYPSCSEWGLPCVLAYARTGGLLPHRFTLAF
jgi:hypothetical protein